MEDPFDLPPDVLRRIPLFAELSKVLSWSGGPINWDLATQIATSIAAGERPAPPIEADDHAAVAEHLRLAEMWLGETTGVELTPHAAAPRAATPSDWADHASDALRELMDPIAAKVSAAMSQQTHEIGDADEAGMLSQALGQMAPMFMGMQAGSIIGHLARDVTGIHDLGVPSGEEGLVLVLPAIDAIATDYGLDRAQVRQWVALRAAAHHRAFDGFPRTHFYALYHNYVASLEFDFAESIRRLQELDVSDPQRLQDALGDEGLFTHQPSPQSRTAAEDIARFRAVVDAHIGAAVRSASARAGDVSRVTEAFRRREAAAGSGVSMLERFIGLEGPPTSSRAEGFVSHVLAAGGWPLLTRLWEDPEAFPTDEELNDPDAWERRVG